MTRARRILVLALAATVAALAVAAVVVLGDPARLKGLAESRVGEMTGRAFVIGGDLRLDWGRQLGVTAEGVRLANADWAGAPAMLEVGRLHVVLDLWSLVAGPVELSAVEVDDLALRLRAREEGPPNWAFGPETAPGAGDAPGIGVLVEHLEGRDLRVEFEGPTLDRPLVVDLDRLRQARRPDGMVALELAGRVNDEPVSLEGEVGPAASLRSGQDVRGLLEGRLGSATLRAEGVIDDLAAPRQPRGSLALAGPDLGDLAERLGIGRVGEGAFELTAEVIPADEGVTLRGDGRFGGMTLDVDGRVRDLPALDGAELTAEAAGPSLGAVLRAFGLEAPEAPFDLRARLARDGPRLGVETLHFAFADATLDASARLDHFPTLDDARVDLRVAGADFEAFRSLLQLPGVSSGPFELEGRLEVDDAGRETVRLTGQAEIGRATVTGTLGERGTHVGARLDFELDGSSLAKAGEALSLAELPADPFRVTGAVFVPAARTVDLEGLVAEIGDDRLRLDGRMDFTGEHGPAGLDVTASGDDLAQVLAAVGVPQGIPAVAYEVGGRLGVDAGRLRLDGVRGTAGNTAVSGDGTIVLARGIPGSDLRLRAEGPDAREVVAFPAAREYVPAGPFAVTGRMRGTDAGIAFEDVDANLAGASVRGSGLVTLAAGLAGSGLTVSASGPDLSRVAPALPGFTPPPGPFELDGRLEKLPDALQLQGVRLAWGGATGRLDLRLGLPLATGASRYAVDLRGPDASVLPAFAGFRPAALPFEVTGNAERRPGAWRIDSLDARLGAARGGAKGHVTYAPGAVAGDLEVQVDAPSLRALGTLDGEPLPDAPLALSAEIAGRDGGLESRRLSARLGDTDAEGRLRFTPGDVPSVELELRSRRLNSNELFGGPAATDEPAGPAADSQPARAPGDRLIPDTPLPLDALRKVNLSVDYAADELVLVNATVGDFRVEGTLQDGALEVSRFAYADGDGTFSASLSFVPVDARTAALSLEARSDRMRTVLFAPTRDVAALPALSLELVLAGRGATWRGLAASLDGHGWLTSEGGEVPNNQLTGLFVGDFLTEFLSAVIPFARTEPVTRVACIALPIEVRDGVLASSPRFVVQTDRVNLLAVGSVDLGTEALDVRFRTQARSGLGLSASQLINPFVRVGGTLAGPELTLDPTGTLFTGTATVATGGTWLLLRSAFESVFRQRDPCGRTMSDHAGEMRKRGN